MTLNSNKNAYIDKDLARHKTASMLDILASILDVSSEGIIALQALRTDEGDIHDFEILFMNEAARRYASVLREDIYNTHFFLASFNTIPRGAFINMAEHVISRDEQQTLPVTLYMDENSDPRWILLRGQKMGEDQITLYISDYTNEREQQREITAKENKYQRIFRTVPAGLMDLECNNPDDIRVLTINPAACALLGYQGDRAAPATLNEALSGDILRDMKLQIASACDQNMQVRCEINLGDVENDPGHAAVYSVVLTPLPPDEAQGAENANTNHLQCIIQDITEIKLAESMVNQSQKMQAVGKLTGGIAHDFNNRLTVISGNLELLERRLKDRPEDLDLVREASASVFSSSLLTKQLLAFSRKQPLYPEIIDCNTQIENLATLLRRTLSGDIELEQDLADQLWPVYADPAQLDSCLVNFALNARDAMPGSGTITMSTANVWIGKDSTAPHPDLKTGPYVHIAVKDTGHGMEETVRSKIFEPFFTTKDVGKGTGLGLATAYGFAKQSNGHLDVESRVDEGTIVHLYLPRYTEHDIKEGIPAQVIDQKRDHEGRAIPAGNGEIILVVEDDTQLRKVVYGMLEDLDYIPLEAADAHEAIGILARRDDINAVFADFAMPGGLNGMDVVEAVQKSARPIPVLMTTGYASQGGESTGSIPPHIPLLQKPYKLKNLAQSLHDILHHAGP